MKFEKTKIVNWLKLTKVPKLGPSKILKLFNQGFDLDEIFSLDDDSLLRTRCFSEQMLAEFHKLKKASNENFLKVIEDCKQNNILIIPIIDSRYPQFLKNISYPPLTLFLKGNIDLLYERKVAIVGSRKADNNAKKWAYNLAKELVKENVVVVSGGAVGIDYSAHKGALDNNGKTICVLGSGFFKMFPEIHKELFDEISKKGLLISEHLPNFPGSSVALVQRNRITSGISNALVMVASGEKGGSMVQTKIAYEQRIPIFCPKKEFNLTPNEGIHQVINKWNGKEIFSSKEILENLIEHKNKKNESQLKLTKIQE